MKVRGIRTPGGDVEGIAISADHAELRKAFESILLDLPASLGERHAGRELVVRCLAVLSTGEKGIITDGTAPILEALRKGEPVLRCLVRGCSRHERPFTTLTDDNRLICGGTFDDGKLHDDDSGGTYVP